MKMIARLHYERNQLLEFLDGCSETQNSEMATHMEQCPQCQGELESIAAEDFDLGEVSDLLRTPSQIDSEAADIDLTISSWQGKLLEPSDHVGSLGRFGRYEVMRCLGRGGMGIVFRVFDPELNRFSAVKILAPELAGSAAARMRFSREAKSAAAVVHPHVVPIQTVDEHLGLPYLVMPVVEGQSLQQRVEFNGPLSIIEVVRIAAQIAAGLGAAHAQGLVHRDIKPANILLENGVERVQITDFGLARAIDDASMTRSGVIAGTPQYMSPEQAHGDDIDHRSDLFSFGSVIYFMLTGHSPFRAETTMGVLNRIGNDQPRKLRSINPDVPEWLEAIVMKLLEKDRDRRFQSAAEAGDLLSHWQAHLQQPNDVEPPQPITSSRRLLPPVAKWLTAIGGVGLFIWLSTIIFLETSKGTIRIESNHEVDIPIRIIQNNETVEHLQITKAGAKTRLYAGEYVIEIDGDESEFELQGDRVTLKRGETWVVTIQQQASAHAVGQPGQSLPVYMDGDLQYFPPLRETANAKQSANTEPVTIELQLIKDSPMLLQGQAVEVDHFREKLLSLLSNRQPYQVVIITDRETPVTRIQSVIDSLEGLGKQFYEKVTFTLRQIDAKPKLEIDDVKFPTREALVQQIMRCEHDSDWSGFLDVFDDEHSNSLLIQNLDSLADELDSPPAEWTSAQQQLRNIIQSQLVEQDPVHGVTDFMAVIHHYIELKPYDRVSAGTVLATYIENQIIDPRELMAQIANWSKMNRSQSLTPRTYRLFDPIGWKATAMSEDGKIAYLLERVGDGWLVASTWSTNNEDGIEARLNDWPEGYPKREGDKGTPIKLKSTRDSDSLKTIP